MALYKNGQAHYDKKRTLHIIEQSSVPSPYTRDVLLARLSTQPKSF